MNLAEIMSEQNRTGRRKRPNPNNDVTLRRKRLEREIKRKCEINNFDESDVALDYVNKNINQLNGYVMSKGEQPMQNPVALSVQVMALREKEIEDLKRTLGIDRSEAMLYLDDEEAASYSMGQGDNFIGGLLSAIGSVASKGINKIKAKRQAAGKPTKFWDFLSKHIGGQAEMQTVQAEGKNGVGNDIKILANDVFNSIRDAEKKKEINKILPFAIVGVIVLILVTVLITKNASKR